MNPQPRKMKVSLLTAPQNPLGTLFYVWKQSRHNKPLPSPHEIESVLSLAAHRKSAPLSTVVNPGWVDPGKIYVGAHNRHFCAAMTLERLGYGCTQLFECAQMIRDEIQMILHESIPVVENLHFVFHLENIPISLREQLVRHRIGTSIDPRVGADIAPVADGGAYAAFQAMVADLPSGAVMNMATVPDLAESTWWSQTSRVINQGAFYDEGRFVLPESLAGKEGIWTSAEDGHMMDMTAEDIYRNTLLQIQSSYNALVAAGVHIEDARQLIPVGATHGITWGLNLKAMLHIFGKRSSWIAQIGIWGDVMGQMADELVKHVHPMLRMVLMPQCITKGKYTGCPVNGTNVERIQGTDGMPPCPLWVRYQTQDALDAADAAFDPSQALMPAWSPNSDRPGNPDMKTYAPGDEDIRGWDTIKPVEREMLERTAAKYSALWGFNIFDGIPDDIEEVLS